MTLSTLEFPRADRPGLVSLVGAGPGDPELLTLRAWRRLQVADVVLHDRLVSAEILALAGAGARLLPVGKAGGGPSTAQEAIHALLVREALAGHHVVRLKGGDPFVFGRGGEEALVLSRHGIPFEVVPGISSALAAPASVGIPVTHRLQARSLTVVTGASVREEADLEAGWRHLARAGGTLVFLMSLRALERIVARLLEAGLAPTTPAAMVQAGTCPNERVVSAPLGQVAAEVAAAGLGSPALLVIGEVVALRDEFTTMLGAPLFSDLLRARAASLPAVGLSH